MPFDGSGNFSRIYSWQSDRDNGIHILASRMDGEFDNVVGGLNLVFFRNGLVPMTGALNMGQNSITGIAAGSVGALPIRFGDDASTGVFLNGVGKLGLVAAGGKRFEVNNTGAAVTGALDVSGALTQNLQQVWHAGNLNPTIYAPLAGASFTGQVIIGSTANDTAFYLAGAPGESDLSAVTYGGQTFKPMALRATNISMRPNGTEVFNVAAGYVNSLVPLQQNGNQVWHAGNFAPSSYAPLTGAAFTGAITQSGYQVWHAGNLVSPATQGGSNVFTTVNRFTGPYPLRVEATAGGVPPGSAGLGMEFGVTGGTTPYIEAMDRTGGGSVHIPFAVYAASAAFNLGTGALTTTGPFSATSGTFNGDVSAGRVGTTGLRATGIAYRATDTAQGLELGFDGNNCYIAAVNRTGNGVLPLQISASAISAPSATSLSFGTTPSTATPTPLSLSLGGTFSSVAGANPKLKVYDDGTAADSYGIGVSSASLDYIMPAGAHSFWIAGTKYASLNSTGFSVTGTSSATGAMTAGGAITAGGAVQGTKFQTGTPTRSAQIEVIGSTFAYQTFKDGAVGTGREFAIGSGYVAPATFSIFDYTANAERMRIDASANINFTGQLQNNGNQVWHAGNLTPGNYAPLASPALTGVPTAPTAAGTSNDTTIATTGFVRGNFARRSVAETFTGAISFSSTVTKTSAGAFAYQGAAGLSAVITRGTAAPTGGADGDMYFQYT